MSNVKTNVIAPNVLGIKDIEENIEIKKVDKQNNNSSLHIIYNKYYFNDIYLSKHCKTKIQSDRFFD